MKKEELKSKYPQAYNEILQEGVMQERKEAQARIEKEKELKESFNFKLN